MTKKIIGYWIAWILTIGWASVVITHDDVAQQYKTNTWKELVINENELSSFAEIAKETKESKDIMEETYKIIDCVNYEYNFSSSCEEVKSSIRNFINTVDWTIKCYDTLATKYNLERSDLFSCVSSEKATKDAVKQYYIKTEWICGTECQSSMDAFEYNIAVYQAYLNKLN